MDFKFVAESVKITAMIYKDFLPGGKISKRTNIAKLESTLTEFEYNASALAIKMEIKKLINKIISIDNLYAQQNALLSSADSLISLTKLLNQKGNASGTDILKASLSDKKIKLSLTALSNARHTSVTQLTRATGISNPDLFEFSPDQFKVIILPGYTELINLIGDSPELSKYRTG